MRKDLIGKLLLCAMAGLFSQVQAGEWKSRWSSAGQEISQAASAVGSATAETAEEAWEATKQVSGEAWEATKEVSGEAWHAASEAAQKSAEYVEQKL